MLTEIKRAHVCFQDGSNATFELNKYHDYFNFSKYSGKKITLIGVRHVKNNDILEIFFNDTELPIYIHNAIFSLDYEEVTK